MRRIDYFFCMIMSFFILCFGFSASMSFISIAAVDRVEVEDSDMMHIGEIVEYGGKEYIVYKIFEGEVYLRSLTGVRRVCDHSFELSDSELIQTKISGSTVYCYKSRYKNYYICLNCDTLNIRYTPYVKDTHMFYGGRCENVVNDKQCTAKE